MNVQHPLALMLLVLAALPFLKRRTGDVFVFSSFEILPENSCSRVVIACVKAFSALTIAGLSFGLTGVTLDELKFKGIHEGAEIVFIRDCSGTMFDEYLDKERKFEKIVFATDLIEKFVLERPGDAYALIDFGSATVTKSKLTFDKKQFIKKSRLAPANLGGTIIDSPIVRAISFFSDGTSLNSRAIILMTDGGGRMNGIPEMARWVKERNINFWYVFIGPESDWLLYSWVPDFVKQLGSLGRQFRGDKPVELEMAMAQIRSLQKGIVRYPEKIYSYRLDRVFYGFALVCFSLLAFAVIGEMAIKQGEAKR